MNTGHEGSLATVHANSAFDALGRLETLASMSELELPVATIRDQVNSAIDLVIHLERGADGTRRVSEVAALMSSRRADYDLVPLRTFRQDPIGPDRHVTGTWVGSPLPQVLRDRLLRAGETVVVPEGGAA
jgi:pilus assembly protein CpaF